MADDAKNGPRLRPTKPSDSRPPVNRPEQGTKLAECLAAEEPLASNAANAVVALRYLDHAANSFPDVRMQANTKAVAGYIYEHYLADFGQAIACYRAALKIVPGDKTLIDAVERLERESKAQGDPGKPR